MDSKLVFPCIFLFFLSWVLQGFSLETKEMDGENKLEQGFASILQQVQQQGGATTTVGGASIDAMPCMQKLIPCQPFMHSPSPPMACCAPLKDMIKQESQCLCKAFNNPEFLKTINITTNEALALSKACGIGVDISVCKNTTLLSASPSPTTQSTTSKSSILSSNSSDSSNSSSSNSNAGVKICDDDDTFWFIASIVTVMFSTLYI